MMGTFTKISEIQNNISRLNVEALVIFKSEIQSYGTGPGRYINLDLFDLGETIRLTLFNDDVLKANDVKIGRHYLFFNLCAKRTDYRCENKHSMQLLAKGKDLIVQEKQQISVDPVTPSNSFKIPLETSVLDEAAEISNASQNQNLAPLNQNLAPLNVFPEDFISKDTNPSSVDDAPGAKKPKVETQSQKTFKYGVIWEMIEQYYKTLSEQECIELNSKFIAMTCEKVEKKK